MARRVSLVGIIALIAVVFAGVSCKGKKGNDNNLGLLLLLGGSGYKTVTISAAGGTYEMDDGITFTVPAGAVAANTDIKFRRIANSELVSLFSSRGLDEGNIIAAFDCLPDGMTFSLPVTVTVASPGLLPGSVPIIHDIDLRNGAYRVAPGTAAFDPDTGSLQFDMTHFSGKSAEVIKEMRSEECENDATSCRCGAIEVTSSDSEAACTEGNCQISDSVVSVRFLDCEGRPVEESKFSEVGPGCAPKLDLAASPSQIKACGTASVTATVKLGCKPLEGQSVDFTVSGPATIDPAYAVTSADGTAGTTLTAINDEGSAAVTARSTVSYYTYWISASAGGVSETVNGPMKTEELSANAAVTIDGAEEVWAGTFTVNVTSCAEELEFCLNNYSADIDFRFSIDRGNPVSSSCYSAPGRIRGDGTVVQLPSSESFTGDWWLEGISYPSPLSVIVPGLAYESPSSVGLSFSGLDWNYDVTGYLMDGVYCYSTDEGPECPGRLSDLPYRDGFIFTVFGSIANPSCPSYITVNLTGDTVHQTGACYFSPDMEGDYVLDMSRQTGCGK